MNYTKVQRLAREDVESNLIFLGFVILENRLKPDTARVINALNAAKIRTIMITGDNILTAMSVARDCGIVRSSQAVITVHADPVGHSNHVNSAAAVVEEAGHSSAEVEGAGYSKRAYNANEAGHQKFKLQYTLDLGSKLTSSSSLECNGKLMPLKSSSYSLANNDDNDGTSSTITVLPTSDSLASVKTTETWTHNDVTDLELGIKLQDDNSWRQQFIFAMDGKTWQIIKEHFPEKMEIILTRGSIYARMSPDQKQALVMELQNLDYCVAMCGDGANDCGALKVANAGISLSETESSIASPFTSRSPTIASVIKVIKEGRAALVTSFGIFKYMAAYSLVQFISVMILYSIDSNLTDKQYLYVDLGLISIFAFFFGKTESFDGNLVKQVPLSSLISSTPLASFCCI